MDKSRKFLSETEAFYLLNHERYVNGKSGASIGKTTPLAANYAACELEQPVGENYCVGVYRSPITNEVYSFHYNNSGVHYILRITTDGCEIVYTGLLELSADPKHSIEQWRVYLKVDRLCKNRHGKALIWTDGKHDIGMLDVEASIATDNFSTPFFQRNADGREVLQMCVPKPCGCIQAEFIKLEPNDIHLTNNILDTGFQFMYRHIYYDNRASDWSTISSLYYQNTRECFELRTGHPRCMKLTIPLGNPLVDKIEIAFTKGNGIWYLTDTVEKYKSYNSTQEKWYERGMAEELNYTPDATHFEYEFCNDKQCQSIDPSDIERVYNPIPREAQGLIPVKDALGFYNYKQGTCVLDKHEVGKFEINLKCNYTISCDTELTTIKVRAVIHNFRHNRAQFIYVHDSDPKQVPAYFGGLNEIAQGFVSTNNGRFEFGWEQTFDHKPRNFIAYIEGTNYWAEMKQWQASKKFVNRKEYGMVTGMGDGKTQRLWQKYMNNENYFFQEAIFKVPKGMKGFIRLVSHNAQGYEPDTSTNVLGILDDLVHYSGDGTSVLGRTNKELKEIYFDTCNKNTLDIMEAFVIRDNGVDAGLATKASSIHGYVKDEEGKPLEGVWVAPLGGIFSINYTTTDHNGYFNWLDNTGSNGVRQFIVQGELACDAAWSTLKQFPVEFQIGENVRVDVTITLKDDAPTYDTSFYKNVKVPVIDCNGLGVGGVRVTLSGSKYRTTDVTGIANFKIRNYASRTRKVRSVVVDHKGCFTVDCAYGCNHCIFFGKYGL